ncbi:hNH endonuclease [Escherichia coli]|uniref:hNH endonuclease n=1 Tax=Escherichia coli TaxID=562 RepID=UPI000854C1C5|nr:hNH endonuclease [Escherichia coli]EFH5594027.1 hNH endonuclease [Escherichia coli]EFI1638796.1 hNH endonuclease [Escherichia coli]OEN44255.1 hNH endonuclease [Escherichia coli]SQO88062.1 CPS-53 (KpLE1) prophage protein [Escherichia coli]HCP1628103.1 hNH endonuclease [Escherichia coli]
MKQMSLIEMDGFLKGKCIPCDLKVNETNAEYLVRKFAEAEAKISALYEDHQKAIESIKQADSAVKLAHEKFSALAAESAMLKQRTQQLIDIISNTDNNYCMCGSAMKNHVHGGCGYPTGMFDYYYNQWLESDNKTPATDAFLAEVRAQGVDMARNAMIDFVDGEVGPNKNVPGLIRGAEICVSIAEQLRKGGKQ